MIRLFALLLTLSACGAAPQKSLSPDLGSFETAFVETGRTEEAWSVAHIVRRNTQHALVVYVRRTDGQPVRISHAKSGVGPSYQRVQIGETAGALIPQTVEAMEQSAKQGFETTLCGPIACYPVNVPAALYQQALLE